MGSLWDGRELESGAGRAEWPGWLPEVYREFTTRLLADRPEYPCHFGVHAQRAGHNLFAVLDDAAPADAGVAGLARTLVEFRDRAWTGPVRQSLIVFAGPPTPDADWAGHHQRFWSVLGELTRCDPRPWPAELPRDVTDPHWQWCFAGEPWFVFACSPAYRRRRSRDLGPCLTLVFQVRRVFEGLSGSTPAGRAAKRRVRGQLLAYDGVGAHPHLGDPQHSSVHKWRQYMVPDDDRVVPPQSCPFPASAGGAAPVADIDPDQVVRR